MPMPAQNPQETADEQVARELERLKKHLVNADRCGIYGVRPFACRIYYNFAPSSYYCQNPNDLTLQLFDGVRRHLEQILGPYCGGYRP